jgi:prepilin-type N-terminal cleavage/methylation domain-containing protein
MQHISKSINKKQTGFTLIELLVALAILAIIAPIIANSMFQMTSISASSKNRMEAIKQVENALLYINQDAQMAQILQTGSGSRFPLTITYRDWSGTRYSVNYSIITPSNGNPKYLQRSQTIGTGQPTIRTVANYVDDTNTSCSYDDNLKELTVTLTSKAGGYKPASETRTLKVSPRPIQ